MSSGSNYFSIKGWFLFSADEILSEDDVDINYLAPDSALDLLRIDFTSQASIDLSDTDVMLDYGRFSHLCGLEGVHLIVKLDPYNLVDELDEGNNVEVAPIMLENCLGELI